MLTQPVKMYGTAGLGLYGSQNTMGPGEQPDAMLLLADASLAQARAAILVRSVAFYPLKQGTSGWPAPSL